MVNQENLKYLEELFSDEEIDWRIDASGKKADGNFWARVVPYLDARSIYRRLDDVCTKADWQDEIKITDKGVLATISINTEANGRVKKTDGSDETQFEKFKGSISRAICRAAVHWGIGSYLYDCPQVYAKVSTNKIPGFEYAKTKEGVFYWQAPKLSEVLKIETVEPNKGFPETNESFDDLNSSFDNTPVEDFPKDKEYSSSTGALKNEAAGLMKWEFNWTNKKTNENYKGRAIKDIPKNHLFGMKEMAKKYNNIELYKAIDEYLNTI